METIGGSIRSILNYLCNILLLLCRLPQGMSGWHGPWVSVCAGLLGGVDFMDAGSV